MGGSASRGLSPPFNHNSTADAVASHFAEHAKGKTFLVTVRRARSVRARAVCARADVAQRAQGCGRARHGVR
jgi:hypothetical protein